MSRVRLLWTGAALAVALMLLVGGCAHKKPPVSTTLPPTTTSGDTTGSNVPPSTPGTPETQPGGKTGEETSALQDVHFDYDSAELSEEAKGILSSNGGWLLKNTSVNVQIEGHCDERGTVEYNLALGDRRAQSAKDFLLSYGVPEDRMSTISYGEERPLDSGHDESAWAKNRRVHFVKR
jgi:peptidoglycan-associated lipoprotein